MSSIVARVLAVFIALITISNSFLNIFSPESQIASTQLVPQGIAGLSNFRVGMGAPFLTAGLLAAFAAWRLRREALIPVMVFFGCVVIARVVGFVVDGYDVGVAQFTVLAVVILGVATASYRLMPVSNYESNDA